MPTATLNAVATTDEAAILSLISSLIQAHYDKSAEGLSAPYAPHAVIYDLEPPLMHDGISVERKRNWLATWDSPIGLEPRDFDSRSMAIMPMATAICGWPGRRRESTIPSASGCAKPSASSALTAHGASSTNTRPCRFIWMRACGQRSICSREEQHALSCAACVL